MNWKKLHSVFPILMQTTWVCRDPVKYDSLTIQVKYFKNGIYSHIVAFSHQSQRGQREKHLILISEIHLLSDTSSSIFIQLVIQEVFIWVIFT